MSKPRKLFSDGQKLQYAKMVVEDGYTIVKVATIADASTSAVGRWKRQYLKEKQGVTPRQSLLYHQSTRRYNVSRKH